MPTRRIVPRLVHGGPGGAAGLLAAAVAIGVGELAAAAVRPQAAPVVAVGGAVIDRTPRALKEFAIRQFGERDKLVLLGGIVALLAVFAVLVGVLARRRPALGTAGIAVFGAVGAGAALTRPGAGPADALPSLAGALVAAVALRVLASRLSRSPAGRPELVLARPPAAGAARTRPVPGTDGRIRTAAAGGGRPARGTGPDPSARDGRIRTAAAGDGRPARGTGPDPSEWDGRIRTDGGVDEPKGLRAELVRFDRKGRGGLDRRGFLVASGATGALAALAGLGGRALQRVRFDAAGSRERVRLPAAADPAGPLPAAARLGVPGISPYVTANRDFYRVDTALVVPQVPTDTWTLRVHGMVRREIRIDYPALLARPLIERDITMTCVSNEVGGGLVGTARWLGAPLKALLEEAGVRPGADQILSTSADGMTIGTPTAVVLDGRDAMLAVGMNGEPLPLEHGFPVRMLVPGLYGYVSGTKWLVDLELTTFAAKQPYWVRRRWAPTAPIRTSSRIDVPKPFAQVPAGRVAVAGVAWAQHRGIGKVEVRVDDGDWRPARLAAEPSTDLWAQWVYEWDAPAGPHTLAVRATDRSGQTQTDQRARPFPSGSTGWHSVVVTVT